MQRLNQTGAPSWAESIGIVAPKTAPRGSGLVPGVVSPEVIPPGRSSPAATPSASGPLLVAAAVVAGLLWWRR